MYQDFTTVQLLHNFSFYSLLISVLIFYIALQGMSFCKCAVIFLFSHQFTVFIHSNLA